MGGKQSTEEADVGTSIDRVAVLGTGSWGTTFAQVLADAGHDVKMWGRRDSIVEMVNSRENSAYLPGVELSTRITATADLAEAVSGVDAIALAVPVGVTGQVVAEAAAANPRAVFVALSKGIEPGTRRTVAQIVIDSGNLDPALVTALSGPNLSMEIAMRQPAAAVVAGTDVEVAKAVARACHNDYFRPYVTTDVEGVEVAGAAKNVIALAIGASEGMGLGSNTRATLITRGLAEMTRLGVALGARPATFAGLAGIGDLVATCSSRLSRNYSLGYRLGKGMSLEEALALSPGIAEGIKTARPMLELAQDHDVDVPITSAVVEVVEGRATVVQMGEMLLGRPQKMDGWEIELLD